MTFDSLLPALLVAQGVIGDMDTLLNHELIERLPHRPEARPEIGRHWIREAIYGTLFGGLARFAWHGIAAALIGALLIAQVLIDASDQYVENRIRVLPQNERVLHFILTLTPGFIIAALIPTLFILATYPSALRPMNYGVLSWILSALAHSSFAWSVRDLLA